MIITLTGGVKLLFRFFNRLLGFLVVFTGLWFWLLTYGTYKMVITYNWHLRYSTWADLDLWIGAGAGIISFFIFWYNCEKFYKIMPDNIVTRLIRSLFDGGYRPEREGKNIPTNMIMGEDHRKSVFFFGSKWRGGLFIEKSYVVKPADQDGHILVVGGAGSGKSACIAKNTLETWGAPIVAIDIKGELSAHYKRLAAKYKRGIVVFDPTTKNGWGYDPYYLLHHGGEENLIQNAREIALAIVPLPPNVRDPFWIQAAQNILTATVLYYFGLGGSFTDTMTAIQTTPIDKLIDEIADSDNTAAKMFINQVRDLELKTLAGIATELSNKIMVFATDPLIRAALRNSKGESSLEQYCFTWERIDTNPNGSIFICLPEDRLEQWASVTTLMINQLFRTLERRTDKGIGDGSVKPVLVMLDEAARLDRKSVG
jgi:type IV secretory pathway TraG/TraD family ATPase VirD4